MEQRLANAWRMTVNEKKFIESAILSDLRIDGRGPFDYRSLTIKLGREDGSSEVYLGQTYVMGTVTSQLIQPYRDRPNDGSLAIYTEFSPMADPSFEVGRPGESAVELGRIIDRGLRESGAVDTESLCVVAGKWVWSIRVDLHILNNGGNLVDAANIAALAALLTFRRPECSLGGEDGQEVIIHPPEVREPLPLIIHHLPIAVTFAFIGGDSILVIDPSHFEEAVMGGRIIATINANGDVCAIQKAGGVGVMQSVVMQCLRISSVKAADITSKIKNAVELYNNERAVRNIKRHAPSTLLDAKKDAEMIVNDLSRQLEEPKLVNDYSIISQRSDVEVESLSSDRGDMKGEAPDGGLSCWNSYSKSVDADELKATFASNVAGSPNEKVDKLPPEKPHVTGSDQPPPDMDLEPKSELNETAETGKRENRERTLKDAVKPKHKRKKKKAGNAS